MIEFKVLKTTHPYSTNKDKIEYAIVTTCYIQAEPDSIRGLYFDGDKGYIIAKSLKDATNVLFTWVDKRTRGQLII